MTNSDVSGIFFLVALASLAIGIPISFHLDKKLHLKRPSAQPFKWGYFIGVSGCIWLPIGVLALWTSPGGGLCLSLIGVCGIFAIKRHRWALVCLTIISFNPASWIINGIYIANRWKEMETADDQADEPHASPIVDGFRRLEAGRPRKPALPVSEQQLRGLFGAPPPMPRTNNELESKMYHIAQNGEQNGPITFATLRAMQKAAMIKPDALYWYTGMSQWLPLRDNAVLAQSA